MYITGFEGDFSASNASAVLFLWKNWQHYFRLANRFVACEATSKLSWEARGVGGTGEWYLTQHFTTPDYGLLHYHNYIQFMGALFKFQTIFQYARVKKSPNGEMWYCGGGFGEGPTRPLTVARPLGTLALMSIGRTGGKVAARLTQNPGWLDDRCGYEARALYEEYVAEEARWIAGAREHPKYFDGYELRPISLYEGEYSKTLRSNYDSVVVELQQCIDACGSNYDPTLIHVATKSFDYGVPGASVVALRDFMRQHGLHRRKLPADALKLSPKAARLMKGASGRLNTYMSFDGMCGADITSVMSAVHVVRAAISKGS